MKVLDALEVLERRLNAELPPKWRDSYGYRSDPVAAVIEAADDALDLNGMDPEEHLALATLRIAAEVREEETWLEGDDE